MLDVVSGLVVAGSLKIAAQPPDEKYPFGYGKVEPAAAHGDRYRPAGRGRWHRHSKRPRDSSRRTMRRQPFTLVVLVLVVVTKELLVPLPDSYRRID